jgi:hypothetical protein
MQCPATDAGTWRADCPQYDITVTDADLNNLDDTVETNAGLVAVYNRRGEEEEQLTMVERGLDSNTFSASIAVMMSDAEDCGGGGFRLDGECPAKSCAPCTGDQIDECACNDMQLPLFVQENAVVALLVSSPTAVLNPIVASFSRGLETLCRQCTRIHLQLATLK